MDIRNLGVFASISAVWQAYPDGGREGDYLFIGVDETTGTKYRWNKYALLWENAAVVTETDGRQSLDFSDVQVQNDALIGGNLSVSGTANTGSISSDGTIHADGNIDTDGNMSVGGDLSVTGAITAGLVEGPYKGWFSDTTSLNAAYPNPKVGWWSQVGTSDEYVTYRCNTAGTWTESEDEPIIVSPDVITNTEMANVLG